MDLSAATTDELAETLRARVLANPGPAISLAPAVEQLVGIMTDRLPYLGDDDKGAMLLNLGCYLSDAMRIMRGPGGMSADEASQRVTDVITLTGERLYTAGQQAARERRNGGGR